MTTTTARWCAPLALLALSTLAPAHAQQVINLASGNELYPWEVVASAAGGPPVRKLKTFKTTTGEKAVADRVIVHLRKELTPTERLQIHQQAATLGAGVAKPVMQFPDGYYLIDVTGAPSVREAVDAYRAAGALAASPDLVAELSAVPNDPYLFNQAPNLNLVRLPGVWDFAYGGGVKIAILDSGMDESHPDLAGKVVGRYNALVDSSDPVLTRDQYGHGTKVAGVAAAAPNNMIGIAGVGYDAQLLNVKLSEGNEIPFTAISAGVYWAADHGANVINMSHSVVRDCAENDPSIDIERTALAYAWSSGAVLVAATGNYGGWSEHETEKTTPASCPNVLAVGATTASDTKADFTSFGLWVDVVAPGVNVLTTIPATSTGPSDCVPHYADTRFGYCSGTSYSAAIVSGIAALARSSCGLSNQQTVTRITNTAARIAGTGTNWMFGRVDAAAFCLHLTAPTGLAVTRAANTSTTLRWNDRSTAEQGFHLEYQQSGAATWNRLTVPANAGATAQSTVTGLLPGVPYAFRVRAFDAIGVSDYSTTTLYSLHTYMDGFGSIASIDVNGIDCGGTGTRCAANFATGTPVTLRAVGLRASNGWEYDFHHWEGDACNGSTAMDCVVTMDRARDVVAKFVVSSHGDPPADF